MTHFLTDLKYGLRMLRKHPGLAAISIIALGLGLGLTAMMWSINYGALLRGLPFADADRLMWVERNNPETKNTRAPFEVLDYDAMRRQQTSFTDLGGFCNGTVNVSGGEGQPERYDGGQLTTNVLPMIGVRPMLGRWFTEQEGELGGPGAVILGYDLWRRRFHADRNVVGTLIKVNGQAATVVGVMPEGFKFPFLEELWIPLRTDRLKESRGTNPTFYVVIGKLKPGVDADRATQDINAIVTRLATEFPATNRGDKAEVVKYTDAAIGPQPIIMLWAMMGAVIGVLLIACSNVANLLLARAAMRTREVAVRTALGANRWRIVSQLLAEALVLAAAGAVIGIAIAFYGVRWFNGYMVEARPPFWIKIQVDTPVLLFVGAVTVLAAVVSGIMPALQATGTRIYEVLKDESRGASSMRLGAFSKALVIAEVAISGGVLVGAGFMIQSIIQLRRFDYGVPTHSVFTTRIGLFESTYPDSARRQRFFHDVLTRLEPLPGQDGVALTSQLPGLQSPLQNFAVEGTTYAADRDYPLARTVAVSHGYFHALKLAPLEGRVFTDADDGTAQPVAVVTRNFAAKFFKTGSAIGHRVRFGDSHSTQPYLTIVGVIPDVWYQGTDDNISEAILTPFEQGDNRFVSVMIAASGTRDPMSFADEVRREVAGVDPDQPTYFTMPLDQRIAQNSWFYDVFGKLFMVFGAAALFLAAIGVYGVMSFAVSRRTQEVGVRMALGAGRRHVLTMFLKQGSWQLGVGLLIASGLGFGLAQGIKFVMFQVNVNDPRMYALVAAALALAGLTAVLIPARRATRVDPVVALRYD